MRYVSVTLALSLSVRGQLRLLKRLLVMKWPSDAISLGSDRREIMSYHLWTRGDLAQLLVRSEDMFIKQSILCSKKPFGCQCLEYFLDKRLILAVKFNDKSATKEKGRLFDSMMLVACMLLVKWAHEE
jgi:hypothetical protein